MAERIRERIALPVYEGVDDHIGRQAAATHASHGDKQVQCAPGCAACCYQVVVITSGEALALAKHLVNAWSKGEIAKLCTELAKQSDAIYMSDRAAWFRTGTPCPLLKRNVLPRGAGAPNIDPRWQGTCLAYAHRPISCRAYQVVSPPSSCAPDRGEDAGPIESMDVAVLEMKAGQVLQNGGAMALGRRWAAPLQPALLWCLDWILEGRWPPQTEVNKWLRRVIEWRGGPQTAEEPQAETA